MKTYLEMKETDLLEKAATNLRDRLLVRLLARLGCRVSEAIALTVQDIDLQKSTVTIQHLKTRLNLACPRCNIRLGKSHIFCPRCGSKVKQVIAISREHRRVRMLPIDDVTLDMLKGYIHRSGPISREGKTFIFGIN